MPARPGPETDDATSPRPARVAAAVVGLGVLAGTLVACGSAGGAGAEAQVRRDLATAVEQTHVAMLDLRSADPAATGSSAVQRMAERGLLGTDGEVTFGLDGRTVVLRSFASRAEGDLGWRGRAAALGVCVEVSATTGREQGGAGQWGEVTTEVVPCPEGMSPEVDGDPVPETSLAVARLHDAVPPPGG